VDVNVCFIAQVILWFKYYIESCVSLRELLGYVVVEANHCGDLRLASREIHFAAAVAFWGGIVRKYGTYHHSDLCRACCEEQNKVHERREVCAKGG